jgi:sec-independent protein translocase protein TatA
MMGLDNPLHIAFLLVILLLVFGAKRLPEMGRSLGSGLRGFKESISGESPAEPARLPGATAMSSASETAGDSAPVGPAAQA